MLWRHYKEGVFFLLWCIIFYLPVSNLMPIANPMACRFMYLPSIGVLVVLAFFLYQAFKSDFLKKYSPYLSRILSAAVILICVTKTLFLNEDWKNNYYVGWAWVRDYPTVGRGYALLGVEYFNAGLFKQARGYLEKSVLLGDQVPYEVFTLGKCYIQLGDFESAEALLKQIILRFPDYADPYFALGAIYYVQQNNRQAQEMLEKALMLNPKRPSGYMVLMKVYCHLHKFEAAKDLLQKAELYLNVQDISELRHILEKSKSF